MGYDLVRAGDASADRLARNPRKRPRKPRARVALRLRLDLVEALDRYVARRQKIDDRENRTSVIEKMLAAFLKQKKALR